MTIMGSNQRSTQPGTQSLTVVSSGREEYKTRETDNDTYYMFPVICRDWVRERGVSAFERLPIYVSTVQKNQAVSNRGVYNSC